MYDSILLHGPKILIEIQKIFIGLEEWLVVYIIVFWVVK